MYSFPNLEPVYCTMSSSNSCFLDFIQISQEAGQVVWYSYLLKNFPQFVVTHIIKGFNVVNKAEVDVFLEFSCFFDDPTDVGNLISGSSAFSKSILNIWKFMVLLKPGLENLSITLLACEMSAKECKRQRNNIRLKNVSCSERNWRNMSLYYFVLINNI